MKKAISRFLFGTALPKEYVCANASSIRNTLVCSIRIGDRTFPAYEALFLGYHPVIFGIILEELPSAKTELLFSSGERTMASITLELITQFPLEEKTYFLFRGVSSQQSFESAFHQFNFRIRERLRKKHAHNIDLDPELYNQVKIAYSIPREIKAGVVAENGYCNLFPTDLNGYAGNDHYLISLRSDRKTSGQLERCGAIALWSVKATAAAEIYSLGKNHGADMKPENEHSLLESGMKLMNGLTCETFEHERIVCTEGIHRIHLLKRKTGMCEPHPDRLVHLHRSYVQWHLDHKFEINIIQR